MDELQRCMARFTRHGEPLSVLFLDIDHFKRINDHFGHEAGDKVLCGIANILRGALRDADYLARYGGEEFLVILPRTRILNACRAAERIRLAVENSLFAFGNSEISSTVSIGVADCSATGKDLLQRADAALYAAKNAGRNRVFVEISGKHHSLRPHLDSVSGHHQRQFLRFKVEGISIKLRRAYGR